MSIHDGSKNVKLRQTMGKKNREIGGLRAQVAALQERVKELEARVCVLKDSSTADDIPFNERKFPTRQDMRREIARLTADLARVTGERDTWSIRAEAHRQAKESCEKALEAERARAKGMEEAIRNADPVLDALGDFLTHLNDQVKAGSKINVIDCREPLRVLNVAFKKLDQIGWNSALSPSPAKEPPCEGIKNGLRCSPCVDANRSCQPEGVVPPAVEKPCCERHQAGYGKRHECGKVACYFCEDGHTEQPPCIHAPPAVAPVESLTADEGDGLSDIHDGDVESVG